MSNVNIPNWIYLLILLALLLISGVGEYLHLTPSGSFYTLLLLILGILVPSPAVPSHTTTVVQTPQTTVNTKEVQVAPPPTVEG